MRRLALWKEVGLSDLDAAVSRFQSIMDDSDTVPFEEIDDALKDFVHQFRAKFPSAAIRTPASGTGAQGGPDGESYSRFGLIVELGDDLPRDIVAQTYGIAEPLGLTMYNPQAGYVLGVDDDLGIDVQDS